MYTHAYICMYVYSNSTAVVIVVIFLVLDVLLHISLSLNKFQTQHCNTYSSVNFRVKKNQQRLTAHRSGSMMVEIKKYCTHNAQNGIEPSTQVVLGHVFCVRDYVVH